MQYTIEGNSIIEKTTDTIVYKNGSHSLKTKILRNLNERNTGFQGFTPSFFANDFSDRKLGFK